MKKPTETQGNLYETKAFPNDTPVGNPLRKPNENPIKACLPVFAVLVDFSSKCARESLRKRVPGITPRRGIAHTYSTP